MLIAAQRRRTWTCPLGEAACAGVTLFIDYGPTAHDGTCEAFLDGVEVNWLRIESSDRAPRVLVNREIGKKRTEKIEAAVRRVLDRKDKTWWNLAFN